MFAVHILPHLRQLRSAENTVEIVRTTQKCEVSVFVPIAALIRKTGLFSSSQLMQPLANRFACALLSQSRIEISLSLVSNRKARPTEYCCSRLIHFSHLNPSLERTGETVSSTRHLHHLTSFLQQSKTEKCKTLCNFRNRTVHRSFTLLTIHYVLQM